MHLPSGAAVVIRSPCSLAPLVKCTTLRLESTLLLFFYGVGLHTHTIIFITLPSVFEIVQGIEMKILMVLSSVNSSQILLHHILIEQLQAMVNQINGQRALNKSRRIRSLDYCSI